MKTFPIVEPREYYINLIAKGLNRYFDEKIINPINDILVGFTVINTKDALLTAIENNTVYYKNNAFRTKEKFTNAVSTILIAIGAKLIRGSYYIEKSLIPLKYSQALAEKETKTQSVLMAILLLLANFNYRNNDVSKYIEKPVTAMFETLQRDIYKGMVKEGVPLSTLGFVSPKTPQKETSLIFLIDKTKLTKQSNQIAKDYIYNLQFWIKKWEEKNIIKMRKDVLKMIQEGASIIDVQNYFINRWNIAKNKAIFLARNESYLASTAIKADEYKKIGATKFIWGKSSSKEKRKLHETYYNKVFDLDNPPIIDEKLNIKGLPRQIWNCKCHMLVVVPDFLEKNKIQSKLKKFTYSNEKDKLLSWVKWKIKDAINNSKQCNNNPWRYRRIWERQAL